MVNCNCTLAGTKACRYCSNNTIDDYWAYKNYPITTFIFTTTDAYKQFETYNPETHELVEKKDAKIKRIKASLEASKRQKDNNKALIEQSYSKIAEFQNNIKVCEEDIKKLEQELKELEG